ncbi:hypothetical protein AMS68_006381 [Peltaster fructicola]|uniref:Mannan endo-1,6-alpha-mannosidase n=1 Tax=Peltaster fructicola TaxID=286661 RepID=A0A6H0Y1H5_9PEZI|nr:hypothetical protein AMS68_006381 [Peltaster fructicola]
MLLSTSCFAISILLGMSTAIQLDVNNQDSIKAAAKTIAHGMVSYYTGDQYGQTPGLLPEGYYWWEAGAMFGSLINYWYYTGDTTYNSIVMEAMLYQAAPTQDFMPQNQSRTLGNDDQAFWAISAMQAAEYNFENPPADSPQFNNGYDYKNSISQGCFFDLAARLGAYTGNTSYFDHADQMWEWSTRIGLVNTTDYAVFDGSDDKLNCTELNHLEWSYNNGIFLHGAAVMWNQTNGTRQALWRTRMEGLIAHSDIFFNNSNTIMTEQACESANNCNTDQQSFKAYLSRWQAATIKLAPWTTDLLFPRLKTSAQAAAQSCSGGTDGVTCGGRWWWMNSNGSTTQWDGRYGAGQQMSALEVVQSLLQPYVSGPMGNGTGATSIGDAGAGTARAGNDPTILAPITTADRAGAGILTVMAVAFTVGGGWWLCFV